MMKSKRKMAKSFDFLMCRRSCRLKDAARRWDVEGTSLLLLHLYWKLGSASDVISFVVEKMFWEPVSLLEEN